MKEFNVSLIIRDHKETWDSGDLTNLIHSMPRDNVVEEYSDPTSDNYAMISCPGELVDLLYKDVESGEIWSWGSKVYPLGTWLMDYGWDEDGFHWDGKQLWVIEKGKEYTMKQWEEIIERRNEEDLKEI
jgi:hypothetical protein